MRGSVVALSAAGLASAAIIPKTLSPFTGRAVTLAQRQEANPFEGKELTPNPVYAEKLEAVYDLFTEAGDAANAAKTREVQQQGTFFWISQIASLPDIDDAIAAARARQSETGQEQIVGLVLYNLPDRDCSGEESSGELESDKDGLARYKAEYVDVFASKVAEGTGLTFAIVLEPDAIPNIVTNQGIPFCAQAAPVYEEGIAYAISKLQLPNVHLYLDAAHGGWLGWDDNLEPCKLNCPHKTHRECKLTSHSRPAVRQGRRARQLQRHRHDPRLLDQRLQLQPLRRRGARALHRRVQLLRREQLRPLPGAPSRGRRPALQLHHRPGPRRRLRRPRGVG